MDHKNESEPPKEINNTMIKDLLGDNLRENSGFIKEE